MIYFIMDSNCILILDNVCTSSFNSVNLSELVLILISDSSSSDVELLKVIILASFN